MSYEFPCKCFTFRCCPTYLDPPTPDIWTCLCGQCTNIRVWWVQVSWTATESKAFTWELIRHTLTTQTCTHIWVWWFQVSGRATESKAFTWELIRHTLTTQTCTNIRGGWVQVSRTATEGKAFAWELIRHTLSVWKVYVV
jgi:hypothetical protein